MSAFLTVLALWLTPSALVLLWLAADTWLDRREDDRRRAELGLAAVEPSDDLIYQQMCFERWEADL